MAEIASPTNHHHPNHSSHQQAFDISVDVPKDKASKCYDDDGRPRRTGKENTTLSFSITSQSLTLYMWKDETGLLTVMVIDFPIRNFLDRQRPYHNRRDWFRGPFVSLGHSPIGMDCRPNCHVVILVCDILHFLPACRVLPVRWPCLRQEKLYLHGCRSIQPWYEFSFFFFFTCIAI